VLADVRFRFDNASDTGRSIRCGEDKKAADQISGNLDSRSNVEAALEWGVYDRARGVVSFAWPRHWVVLGHRFANASR
jgi:hypothetical protein